MKYPRALALIAIPVAVLTACGSQDHQSAPSDNPLPQPAASPPGVNHPTSQNSQERACGAADAIDHLAHAAIAPDPDPTNPRPKPNGTNLIDYASALQTLDRQALSAPMNAALTAHAYALTNLGALINHGANRDDIDSMATVTSATGRTIDVLCGPR